MNSRPVYRRQFYGLHPAAWALRLDCPPVLSGTKTSLTQWLRAHRTALPFDSHQIVRADFGPLGGRDYVLLLDRPEDHTAVLAGPDGTPVLVDLRPRADPDEVARRTRPAAGTRRALTVHSVARRVIGSSTWTEAHCYDPHAERADLIVFRSSDRLGHWTPAAENWREQRDYEQTGQLAERHHRVLGLDHAIQQFLREAVLLLLRRPHIPTDRTHEGHVLCACGSRH